MPVNSNEIHSIHSPVPNRTLVLQIPLKTFEVELIREMDVNSDIVKLH